jgi:hypothetical protein
MRARASFLALAVLTAAACSSPVSTASPASGAGASATPAAIPRPCPAVRWTVETGGAIWGSIAVRAGVVYALDV